MRPRPSLGSGLRGAVARFFLLLASACLLVVLTTVPLGLLSQGGLNRTVSLGFYVLGAFLVVIGFLGGSRGPLRSASEEGGSWRRGRRLRRASLAELNETINVAAVAIAIGLVLLVIGVTIDSRYRLF